MTDKAVDNPSDKKERNKVFKTISNIVFAVFMMIMAFLIFVTAQSKLTGQEPSLFGYRMYIVDSGSMIPTLPVDSMIIVNEVTAAEIEKDDIVTYYAGSGETRVTHRVVRILEDGEGFITRGDANNTEDPSVLEKDRIIGKLAFSIPYIGTLFRGLSSELGIAVLVIFAVLIMIIPIIIKKLR